MAARRRSETTRDQARKPTGPAPERAHASSALQTRVTELLSTLVGRMAPGSTAAAPLVDFAGNAHGPIRARTTVPLDGGVVERAVATGQGALLVFEGGNLRLPIITGLIWTGQSATPFQELLITQRPAAPRARPSRLPTEARLDGERVVLEGKREVVLKCGEASITLRSDGKMVLRGAYVETYSKGMNRIKGASVKIN